MTPTPQELNASDYQAALDEFNAGVNMGVIFVYEDTSCTLWEFIDDKVWPAIRSALTRCAAETPAPVDAELDAVIAHYDLIASGKTNYADREPRHWEVLLRAAKAYRASLSKGD